MSGGQQGYGQSSYMPPSWAGGGNYGRDMSTGMPPQGGMSGPRPPWMPNEHGAMGNVFWSDAAKEQWYAANPAAQRPGAPMPSGDMSGPWPGLGGSGTKMPGFVGGGYQAAWGPPPGRDMQHMESPAVAAGRTMGTGLASSMGQTGGAEGRPYQWGPVQPPGGGWYPEVTKPMPKADPMAGFQQLLAQDPHAASEALNFNPAWMMQNMGQLQGMVPGGDFGQWRNQYGASTSNAGPITDAQRALIRQKMGW